MPIDSALVAKIDRRLTQLLADCIEAQYGSPSELPGHRHQSRSFAVGAYPALMDFLWGAPGDFHTLIDNATDCSGASFMGLWFLAQAHRVLADLDGRGALDGGRVAALQDQINVQLTRAAKLPTFYQGQDGVPDVWACPEGTMGWYPLVDGYRLPAVLPDILEEALATGPGKSISNLSDGDIWAWCMAIDDTLPHVLEYRTPITAARIYEPLLGSRQPWDDTLHPQAKDLYTKVAGGDHTRLPIGTFYGCSADKPQRYSCAVMANILSSIPLLGDPPADLQPDIEAATSFVRRATIMACQRDPELSWDAYAYDYAAIRTASIGYVARAHKRIVEIDRQGFSRLLDDDAVRWVVDFVETVAWEELDSVEHLVVTRAHDAYANLVYCFSAMANLRWVDPSLFDSSLCRRTAEALLQPDPKAYEVPGTGPYHVLLEVWANMASICFVAPPLIEAYALYLDVESR